MPAIINDKLILTNFSSYSVSDSIKAKIESYVNKTNITSSWKRTGHTFNHSAHPYPSTPLRDFNGAPIIWGGPCMEYEDKNDIAMLKEHHHHHIANHKHLWNTMSQTLF